MIYGGPSKNISFHLHLKSNCESVSFYFTVCELLTIAIIPEKLQESSANAVLAVLQNMFTSSPKSKNLKNGWYIKIKI